MKHIMIGIEGLDEPWKVVYLQTVFNVNAAIEQFFIEPLTGLVVMITDDSFITSRFIKKI